MPHPMPLDLRVGMALPPHLRERFHSIATGLKQPFCDAMDAIAHAHRLAPHWMFTLPASRNPLASTAFHCIATTLLALELQKDGALPATIHAQSAAHARLLHSCLGDSALQITHGESRWRVLARAVCFPLYHLLRSITVWILARHIEKPGPSSPAHAAPSVLIDTFILPGQAERERYYPGILQHLTPEEQTHVAFVPTLFGITLRNARAFLKDIRTAGIRYLLREDFLSFSDIIAAWSLALRGQLLSVPETACKGVDISPIIRSELRSFREFGAAMTGHLARKAHHRFAKAGILPHTVINWFENQPVDRGWNLGAHESYPQARRVGYMAFPLADLHLSLVPSSAECAANMVPMTLAPLGLYADAIRRGCPDRQIERAPSFRFAHLFAEPAAADAPALAYDIFAPLPMGQAEALHILDTLKKLIDHLPELSVAVRPHPATSQTVVDAIASTRGFDVPEGSFAETMARSRILLGNGSSTCLEALLKGVYVIVINTSGLLMNPIPDTVPSDLYHVSFSLEDLVERVQRQQHAPMASRAGTDHALLNECMTPVTDATVRSFLHFPQKQTNNHPELS